MISICMVLSGHEKHLKLDLILTTTCKVSFMGLRGSGLLKASLRIYGRNEI